LNRLRELSRSRGLQVILITHEKLLDTLFDRVIEIPSRR
jgi:ABC-type lipoprotein export system ATPase subunit